MVLCFLSMARLVPGHLAFHGAALKRITFELVHLTEQFKIPLSVCLVFTFTTLPAVALSTNHISNDFFHSVPGYQWQSISSATEPYLTLLKSGCVLLHYIIWP